MYVPLCVIAVPVGILDVCYTRCARCVYVRLSAIEFAYRSGIYVISRSQASVLTLISL